MQRRTGEAIDQLRVALERSHGVGDPFSAAMALSFYAVALGAAEQYAEAARCIAEALERFRGLGSNAHVSRCLVDLAIVRLRSGDLREAAIALLDGVAAATQLGRVPYRFAQLVLASAEVAYASGLPADAARLVAAAATLRRVSGIALAADRVDDEALLLTTLRNELGGEDVDSLLAEGRALHEEEAVVLTRDVLKSVLHREVRVKVRGGQ